MQFHVRRNPDGSPSEPECGLWVTGPHQRPDGLERLGDCQCTQVWHVLAGCDEASNARIQQIRTIVLGKLIYICNCRGSIIE